MSYTLRTYLIDLEALRAAVGSKNQTLIDAIVEHTPRSPETTSDSDEMSCKTALTDLVMGEPLTKRPAHEYGYAVEALCRELGTQLDMGIWDAVRWKTLEATGIDSIIEDGKCPVEIPRIPDFPAIGCIAEDRIEAIRRQIEDQCDGVADEELRELLQVFLEWLEAACHQRKALVLFYY